MGLISKLDFVGISVRDAEAAKTFYIDVLGLKPDDKAKYDVWAGDTCFSIWEPEKMGVPFAPQQNGAPAFHVEDIKAARAELEAKGVVFRGETIDTGVCYIAQFNDPDGNELILHHRYSPRK